MSPRRPFLKLQLVALGLMLTSLPVEASEGPGGALAEIAEHELEEFARKKARLSEAKTPRDRAITWLGLQGSTERIASALDELCQDALKRQSAKDCARLPLFLRATKAGVEVRYCAEERQFLASTRGYEECLKTGACPPSKAELAFWRSRVEKPCCKKECQEPDEAAYKEFLRSYPNSSLRK